MLGWQYSDYSKTDPRIKQHFPFKKPREEQLETISEIVDAIGKGYKYIVLEAGTGTGKSAIAATLANMHESSYILTVTKQLQDQYLRDFDDFKSVKGRSNFTCKSYIEDNVHQSCEEGKCIVEGFDCRYSIKNQTPPECPYYRQKYNALNAKTVIANYHYMFLELNYVEDFTNRELLVCDEAHNLESMLMNQLKLEFEKNELKEYIKYDLSDETISDLNSGNFNDWIGFIEEIKSRYSEELAKIENINRTELLIKIASLKQKINDCNHFIANIIHDPDSWIVDFDEEFEVLEFKPVKVDNYAANTLFDFADVCLFMSATILDCELFAQWLGIPASEIYAIRRKTPFDTARNPIIVSEKYNLSKSNLRVNAPKTLSLIKEILAKHENEKGIIHTVSTQCMYFLMDNIKDRRLIAHSTKNRTEVLEEFKNSKKPLVLVSPSMDEGVDLPGDECRFQIVYKIPYPDLGSKQVKARMTMDSDWYDYKTSLRLVQTHGRGMRYEDDYCTTYFIDNRLKNYAVMSKFIPEDFKTLVRSKDSAEIEALIGKGEMYLENNEYENAIIIFKNLIKDGHDDYRIYLGLSKAYHLTSLYEEELHTILKFLNDHPDDFKHFRTALEKLEEMGYFDINQF
ncbi:helicase C-terminal domain-containing protein [Methanobrevibacter sp.]